MKTDMNLSLSLLGIEFLTFLILFPSRQKNPKIDILKKE